MQSVSQKILTRQEKLKIWIIERGYDLNLLVTLSHMSRASVGQELYYRATMRPEFRELCIKQGLPSELLPPPTRKKADLLAENLKLKQRLHALESQLGLTGQGESLPQAHAG